MDPPRAALTELLDECGCCEGLEVGTPVEVYNRPGLSAIAYRIGTHARFKKSMLAHLSDSRLPALRDLNIRDDDDFTVALLDAWATVADVLKPGVAASAHLAFELEDAPGSPRAASIGKGTQVQSLTGQDELPQTFETVQKIEARPEWNRLRPRQTEAKKPDADDTEVYLKGVTTGLLPGDGLLLVGTEREAAAGNDNWDFRRVKTVTADPDAGRTRVTWDEGLGWKRFGQTIRPARDPRVYAFRQRAALFGHNAPDWRSMPVSIQESYLGRGLRNTDTEWPD